MATQFIALLHSVFVSAGLPLYLHPYSVLIVSHNSALVETVKDAVSLDSLKKNIAGTAEGVSLSHFFHTYFAMQGPEAHALALQNYIQSMAAYRYGAPTKMQATGTDWRRMSGSRSHLLSCLLSPLARVLRVPVLLRTCCRSRTATMAISWWTAPAT